MQLGTIYVRLSDEAKASNLSGTGMVDECLETAAEYGVHVPEEWIFVDDGLSGAVRDRPDFLKWLEVARSAQVQVMITHHGDRLTREGINVAGPILDVVEGKDPVTGKKNRTPVRLVDTYGLDTDSDEDAYRIRFALSAEVARGELKRITARNINNKRRMRAQGRWPGGRPFGYQRVPKEGGGWTLTIDPEEAAFVRTVREKLLAGASLVAIANWANTQDVKPRIAQRWGYPSIRAIMQGQVLMGRMVHKGDCLRDDEGMPIQFFDGILTTQEWGDVQGVLPAKGVGRGRGRRKATELLSGVVHCASCGRKMYVAQGNVKPNGKRYNSYTCLRQASSFECEAPATVGVMVSDKFVSDQLLERFGQMTIRKRVTSSQENQELIEVQAALQAASAAMIEPGANVAECYEKVTKLTARRDALQAAPATTEVRYVDTGKTVAGTWAEGSLEERRTLIEWALTDGERIKIVRAGAKGGTPLSDERVLIPWNKELLRTEKVPQPA